MEKKLRALEILRWGLQKLRRTLTHFFSGQLWNLKGENGDLLSNNTSWEPNITLTFNLTDNTISKRDLPGNTSIPDKTTLPPIISETIMVLGIVGKDVKGVPRVENDRAQQWERGVSNMEGWFTLTNLYAQKVLAAVEPKPVLNNSQVDLKILEIQGM